MRLPARLTVNVTASGGASYSSANIGQLSALTAAATWAAPDGCNMIV